MFYKAILRFFYEKEPFHKTSDGRTLVVIICPNENETCTANIPLNILNFYFQDVVCILRMLVLSTKKLYPYSAKYIQGVFFNWAHPEFAKCWPVSN